MERITLSVDDEFVQSLDRRMKTHRYTSRSEALRDILREVQMRQQLGGNAGAIGDGFWVARPPSAIAATACFSFAVSKATYTSLCSPMVRPSMLEARLGPSEQPSILA